MSMIFLVILLAIALLCVSFYTICRLDHALEQMREINGKMIRIEDNTKFAVDQLAHIIREKNGGK